MEREDTNVIDRPKSTTILKTKPKIKNKRPSMWNVVLMNDDYTPMDFVVLVLQKNFNKTLEESTLLMLEIHEKGKGIAGTYTYEVAETKIYEVMNLARIKEYPLLLLAERA